MLINNAGVLTKGLLLDEQNTFELQRTIHTNTIGMIIVSKEAVKHMKRQEDEDGSIGHIVNINSIFGHKVHQAVPKMRPLNGMYPVS